MDGWSKWIGKKVFIRTNNNRVYSGRIKDIEIYPKPLIWIILIDKFNKIIQFSTNEIAEIKEEE